MTPSVTPDEVDAFVQVLRDSVATAEECRPANVATASLGEQVVVAMFERAFGLARAVLVLIDAGLADEAASQIRSLLEVSVVLSHAAITGREPDHLALIVANYSASQELGEVVAGTADSDARREQLKAEIQAIRDWASARGLKIASSQLDVVALAETVGRKDQVSLVYRRTSGMLHLTRTALSTRIVEDGDRFVVMPAAPSWAKVSMSDLGTRLFTIAVHGAAVLLGWEAAERYEALATEAETRLDNLAEPIIRRANRTTG